MNETFLRTEYVLRHRKGSMSFPTLEMVDVYVDRVRETLPDIDLSDAKLFKIDIYSTDKSFQQ